MVSVWKLRQNKLIRIWEPDEFASWNIDKYQFSDKMKRGEARLSSLNSHYFEINASLQTEILSGQRVPKLGEISLLTIDYAL